MPKRIFIGSLGATATEASLRQMFSPFGTVLAVEFVADEPPKAESEVRAFGQPQAATVTFDDDAAADKAVQELNGAVVDGNTVNVALLD